MDDLSIGSRLVIPASELVVLTTRSSGPGGQSVNTSDSAVELRWDVSASDVLTERQRELIVRRLEHRITRDGVLVLRSREHRSQHRNLEAARSRMRSLVAEAMVPPKPRRATKPTRASQQRRVQAKKRRSEVKKQRRRPEAD